MNSDYTQRLSIIDISITSLPHILRQQQHHHTRFSSLLLPLSSPLGHNPMTNWVQPNSLAAYKPEELLPLPPPSYQDYPKDVRLFQ
ncbi:hypothetical protein BCR42DRAFT_403750 [Absidia repens]|uniref:Uncharacterized protein n=1 Tax=Absidia repens TaxID=90262 RepID=A0A1X2IVA1_9FUNG|nr:hypothetical protein BCR42DRAFT_403750 [Absidia repens]